jgi:hypothetical protein
MTIGLYRTTDALSSIFGVLNHKQITTRDSSNIQLFIDTSMSMVVIMVINDVSDRLL